MKTSVSNFHKAVPSMAHKVSLKFSSCISANSNVPSSTSMLEHHTTKFLLSFLQYPFELDVFQKHAVLKLEDHQSVFVAAHTSAGIWLSRLHKLAH